MDINDLRGIEFDAAMAYGKSCQHLDGNKCGSCLAPGDCTVCLGSGSVNYYDSRVPCEKCKGTGKVKP